MDSPSGDVNTGDEHAPNPACDIQRGAKDRVRFVELGALKSDFVDYLLVTLARSGGTSRCLSFVSKLKRCAARQFAEATSKRLTGSQFGRRGIDFRRNIASAATWRLVCPK